MNAEPIHYSKLPGPSLGWAGRTRLWLAEDHVLEMNWTIFAERYHRYFLHDIRGVIAQRTKTGRMWNIALGTLAAASFALAGAAFWLIDRINGSAKVTNGDVTAVWVLSGMFGAIALFFIALLIFNTLLGPTCRF